MTLKSLRRFVGIPACCTLVLITCATALASQVNQDGSRLAEIAGGQYPLELRHLGTVDGIAYFHSEDEKLSWAGASATCRAANMRLATVRTENQFDLLTGNLTSTTDDYWTGGSGTILSLLSGIGWESAVKTDRCYPYCDETTTEEAIIPDPDPTTEKPVIPIKVVCLSVGKESGGMTIRNCQDAKYVLCQI